MKRVAKTTATRLKMPTINQQASRMSKDKATGWGIDSHIRHPSAGIRMRELPVVECPHIIAVIPAFGRCRCGVDRS